MSSEVQQPADYVLGEPPYQQQNYATFYTKPPSFSNGTWDTGAGYERWRSLEYRPETKGVEKEDVYVSVHRLLAVVTCYPMDMPIEEVLEDLRGKDVHHNAPEVDGNRGVPWDNRPDVLEVIDHGRHSSITNAEKRAWAEDARRKGISEALPLGSKGSEACRRCEAEDTLATSDGFEGKRCLDCAIDEAGDHPIEVIA